MLWATTGAFGPNPDSGVHAFCHAIPEAWHQMGVILAAASSLAWFAQLTGASEASLLAELPERPRAPSPVMFLPYLAVPVGGVLMLLNLTFFILRLVKRRGEEGLQEES